MGPKLSPIGRGCGLLSVTGPKLQNSLSKSPALPVISQGPCPLQHRRSGSGVPGACPPLKSGLLSVSLAVCAHSAHCSCASHPFSTLVSVFLL